MKKIKINIKNFQTKKIIKIIEKETDLNTYNELIKELNIQLRDIIIFNEKKQTFISENNKIYNNDEITLFNTNGQVI